MQSEQKGGRILGQGRYGCAFDPPLKCIIKNKGNSNRHSIGKITATDDAKLEWSISEELAQIPNAKEYFVLLEDYCVPAPRSEQTDKSIKDCKPLNKIPLSDTIQISMPFGGRTLFSIAKRQDSLDFFKIGQHLLEAGTLLLLKGIVHGDIHTMNILATSRSMVRLIDFGVAWRPSELTLINYQGIFRVFNPAIHQEPPEFSLINGVEDQISERIALVEIKTKKTALIMLWKLTGLSLDSQMATFENFIDTSISFEKHDWLSFYKVYWSKVDSWGIGSVLLNLFAEMIMDPGFESSTDFKEKSRKVLEILKGMCNMDVGKRLDCAEALTLWEPNSAVLKDPNVKKWLDTQDRLRSELMKKL